MHKCIGIYRHKDKQEIAIKTIMKLSAQYLIRQTIAESSEAYLSCTFVIGALKS